VRRLSRTYIITFCHIRHGILFRYAQPHTLRIALLGSASVPVRQLLCLSRRDASVRLSADNGMKKGDSVPFLEWTSDHSLEFRTLLRSYLATLDARLRLALAAMHEVGPSASARQASGLLPADPTSSLDMFHAPADANLYAITLDACADSWADPAHAFAKRHLSTFLGPCFREASRMWFASGAHAVGDATSFSVECCWLLVGGGFVDLCLILAVGRLCVTWAKVLCIA